MADRFLWVQAGATAAAQSYDFSALDALPDEALVTTECTANGVWYAVMDVGPTKYMDPDFSTASRTSEADAIAGCAKKIRAAVAATGSDRWPYGTLQGYRLYYELLPYWKKKAAGTKAEPVLAATALAAAPSMTVRDVAPFPEWTSDLLDDWIAQDFSAVVRIQKTDLPRMLGRQQRVVEKMPLPEILDALKRYCAGDQFLRDVEPLLLRPIRTAIETELVEQEDDRTVMGKLEICVEEILEQPHLVSEGGTETIVLEILVACTAELRAARGGVVTAAAKKRKRKKKVKAAEPIDPRLNLDNFQVSPHELQRKIGDMTPYLP